MMINKSKLHKSLAVLALGAAYFIFVKLTGLGIPCIVRVMSGGRILCPGCGISRMFLKLSSFDILGAFRCNPAIFSLLPLWCVCAVFWISDRGEKFLKAAEIFSLTVLIIFGILRNFL